jgi:uncharacterized surface protein with fasciclin (FAS1) repeats
MQESSNHNTAVVSAVVALVVGGLVGFGVTAMAKDNTIDDLKSKSSTAMKADAVSSETDGVTVGGAKMVESKDIVDNAVNAKNVTTVVAAVKAAGLVDTLKSAGPFTVFAPNNDAFAALPAGTVDTLLKPENKATLTSILTLHVVPGTYTSAALRVMAAKGETLTTVQGETLKPVIVDNKLEIQDPKGNNAEIETSDVISSNGVTFVIKSVLMPN